jgi:hypothetical protein
MKTKIKSFLLLLVVTVTSCGLPDNVDPKSATVVTPASLITTSEINLFTQVTSLNTNYNISRLLTQYHSEVTYVTESRYNFSDRKLPDAHWGVIYRDVLTNLEEAKKLINATDFADAGKKANQLAIIGVLEAYSYQLLVDVFGNVPYTEANLGSANSRPKYDDAKTVYYAMIDQLSSSITNLTDASEGFGDADILYKSDITSWKLFASSLKLRFALRISDSDAAKASTMVKEAIASGLYTDESESAIFTPTGTAPYVGCYYDWAVINARPKDYVPAKTLINIMNSVNDPRRAIWFTKYKGAFVGLTYGLKAASSYSKFSNFNSILQSIDYPAIILDYSEVEFLLAEAAERGLGGVTGTAESHYNNAITANLEHWKVSAEDIATYLAQPTVAYTTSTGTWKQKIGTQKWIALYDEGYESYAEWRRLDFPILTPPQDMTYSDIPVRYPYPFDEVKYNKDNYTAAAAAIGGDLPSTKLFWDKF